MNVTVANTAGFCFGVKRAVETVYRQLEENPGVSIYTWGPIIHNEQVLADLEEKGVKMIESLGEAEKLERGIIIVRAHGVSRELYEKLQRPGVQVIDATCPFVKKIHRIVEAKSGEGYQIVVVGNRAHPEVQGIVGWSKTPAKVVESVVEASKYCPESGKPVCIVAQTTFNYKKFQDVVEKISEKSYDSTAVDTICNATYERQREAAELAAQSDMMLVIGGRSSSNTQKLYEICRQHCPQTHYIQTARDIADDWFWTSASVGITAGASTPKNIIEEVHTKMSELSFDQMLEENLKTIHTGEVVTGTVIDVKDDQIILNIGYKSDGIITKSEYSNDSSVVLSEVVKPGDTLEAKIVKVNDGEGQVVMSYKRLAADRSNKRLEEAFNNNEVLTATVSQVLDGGLSVNIDGARVFIPASLVSDTYERNLEKYAGQEIEFVITEFNPRKRRVIGNRKMLIVEKKAALLKELFDRIEVGMTVTGTVKNITDFGAFIDLGGADGLLHISEMSWGRIENPKKVFKVGQEVTAFIKDINGDRIALSMKFEDQNPWANAAERYAPGTIVEGRVARMTDFGAFVELASGVDALLHVSQISRTKVPKPADVLSIGQEITAQIVDFNEEEHKISISMKVLEAPEEEAPVEE